MSIEIKVPGLPESVADATVAKWYKKAGDFINRDENLVDLETDKVMLEVPAPKSGVIEKIAAPEGAVVKANQLLAIIQESSHPNPLPQMGEGNKSEASAASPKIEKTTDAPNHLSPAVRRAASEKSIDVSQIQGSGKGGRITKQDVEEKSNQPASIAAFQYRKEERVPMSRLRQRVAERLVQVQNDAAILTTFNEINMKPVVDLRNKYKEQFEKQTGSRLGFMSFFTKASVEALKQFPVANASIDGHDIVYHNFYDIGIAIGSERGLVVPILRNADQLSMAEIEKQIREFAVKAKDGKIALEDLMGGTFTITNAGTYGSMMSTPIINPPQSAILGMHNIVERAVVEQGNMVIRPIMYVALSYDHRIIDGREAVQFLMTIKQIIEDPARLILQI